MLHPNFHSLIANRCRRVWIGAVCALGLAACQSANDAGQYNLALDAGFDPETGAALPVQETDDETAREQERKRQVQALAEGRNTSEGAEHWASERYNLLPVAPNERPQAGSDEAGIWMIADRAETEIQFSANLLDEPAFTSYIADVVCTVADVYCGDIRPYVVRVPNFNAAMFPNGVMLLHTGFLIRMTSEADMASIIGHEIGHYLLRHSLVGHRRNVDTATGGLMVGIIAGAGGVADLGRAINLLALGAKFEHSRDQERQADGYGYALMVRAGYDPAQAPFVWQFLSQEMESQGVEDIEHFTRTHPVNEQRLTFGRQMASAAREEAEGELETGQDRYIQALLPIRASLLQDELEKKHFNAFRLLLRKWEMTGVLLGEIYYFSGENYRLRGDTEAGDFESALQDYARALAHEGAPPETYRSIGMIRYRLEQYDRASEALTTYLKLVPDARDRSLIESMIVKETS